MTRQATSFLSCTSGSSQTQFSLVCRHWSPCKDIQNHPSSRKRTRWHRDSRCSNINTYIHYGYTHVMFRMFFFFRIFHPPSSKSGPSPITMSWVEYNVSFSWVWVQGIVVLNLKSQGRGHGTQTQYKPIYIYISPHDYRSRQERHWVWSRLGWWKTTMRVWLSIGNKVCVS